MVILMGVSGSGKTTLGRLLAEALRCPFFDADDFHPEGNKQKLAQGIPLADADREPWLETLAGHLRKWERELPQAVLACSALKRSYREKLDPFGTARWVYLKGDRELLGKRIESRQGHFASPLILGSQFQILEEPAGAWVVDVSQDPASIVRELIHHLGEPDAR